VFAILITVWNAHVMAMPVWGKPQLLEQLGELLQAPGSAPQLIDTCARLAARRQEHFAQDPRAVGEWRVTIDPQGRVRLHCDARVPPALTP
jgi:cytochrome c-type biogenesis protein CcmH/NrfG